MGFQAIGREYVVLRKLSNVCSSDSQTNLTVEQEMTFISKEAWTEAAVFVCNILKFISLFSSVR